MAIASAPYTSAATRPRPSKKPPAAITGTRPCTASTTCGSRMVVGTEPVWPPPSPPCTSTASTPHSSTFSAWRLAPIDGTTSTPPSCSCPINASLGAWAKLATFTCSSISSLMRSPMSAASARRFTPNGLVVRCFTCAMALRS